MSGGTSVTLQEYLDTAYSPDREYVDGVVVERNEGERPHSFVQNRLIVLLNRDYPALFIWPEWRTRTKGTRYRVPDLCVTLRDPQTLLLEEAPFLAIEILSQNDPMKDVIDKFDEYAASGVPNVWLFDPWHKRASIYAGGMLHPVTGDSIATSDPVIQLKLDDVFRGV